jgi:hypothetical protein
MNCPQMLIIRLTRSPMSMNFVVGNEFKDICKTLSARRYKHQVSERRFPSRPPLESPDGNIFESSTR